MHAVCIPASVGGCPYGLAMSRVRTYTDDQLAAAVSVSRSWRGVLRSLNLAGTSSSSIKSVRSRAEDLGVDFQHFSAAGTMTESRLRNAISRSSDWTDVVRLLRLTGHSAEKSARAHAARLDIDTSRLREAEATDPAPSAEPDIVNLHRAGSLLAAAWYTLAGYDVSWPLEPCRYDLLATVDGHVRRLQVKTSTSRVGSTWKVYLSTSRADRAIYGLDEIDDFFIIDGDLNCYLIPLAVVGGLHAIHLSAYQQYRQAPLLGSDS